MKFNHINISLLIAFVALPIAGLLLHLKIHPQYTFLNYILLFDIIIITLLYLNKKTIFYGFALNTTFFIVGVIAHLTVAGGWTDVLIAIPDFSIGYVLWFQNKSSLIQNKTLPKQIPPKPKK
ncbi:hypothetical protein HOE04_03395 [archaeon]|jgi:hypothetical protein|nr:hypothetical protein [archaeon]